MRSAAIALLVAAATTAFLAAPAAADDAPPAPASPPALAQLWSDAETEMAAALADEQRLAAQPPATELLLQVRQQLQVQDADYRYRDAARAEQVVVYAMAVDPAVQSATEPLLPAGELAAIRSAIGGLRALWRAAGITDLSTIQIRHNRDFQESAPVPELLGYYHASGAHYGVDWSILASINYVESDFGRVNGPSSAGALGPMQFMPATWAGYGGGGDIMSPHDSIAAAARYLSAMGAGGNLGLAILRYNNDWDYVASVESFAAAFRADPSWFSRMYYWSTAG